MEPLKVEKFTTANRGNGLRAVAPLRPGELLFRSDPLAYTVSKGSRGVVCDRCLLGFCLAWGYEDELDSKKSSRSTSKRDSSYMVTD
ncbi:SET and MYND domain-containing protein 3 [Fukomys damarensis]|uniref:SET and MYND domain-containing protein 3 n=1 Tax=Fukomys damarensis TaxID=885580 RepID=A0A091DRM7_FUKDA|nr:SET and MYND domain-containing protein 3 [Fukomys damarensis]